MARAAVAKRSGWSALPRRYRWSVAAAALAAVVLYGDGNSPLLAIAGLCVYLLALDAHWAHRYRARLAAAGQPAPSVWKMLRAHADEERKLWYLRKQWPAVMTAQGLLTKTTKTYPDLYDLTVTVNGDITAMCFPEKLSLPSVKITQAGPHIARAVGARELTWTRIGSDGLRLAFLYSDPLDRIVTTGEMKIAALPRKDEPVAATFGARQSGQAAVVPVHLSFLIGGGSGGGKSSIMWAVLGCLNYLGVWVDLYVSDPKGGMEMRELGEHIGEQMGRFKVRSYADTDTAAAAMITSANGAMAKRQRELKAAGIRRHTPTQENPLVIVIIDELLADPKMLKNAATGDLGNILSQGRACGYIVMAGTQLGQKTTLGDVRDLFPNRICVRTESPDVTDVILGSGAEARGALCSQIAEHQRGVGWSRNERGDLEKFRAVWVPDADRERIALGMAPKGMGVAEKPMKQWCVYQRFYPDRQCAYIGITDESRLAARDAEHAQHPDQWQWWAQLDRSLDTIQWFDTEAEARTHEEYLIKAKRPIHNKQHNTKNAARAQRWDPQPTPRKVRRQPKPEPANVVPIRPATRTRGRAPEPRSKPVPTRTRRSA